MQPNLLLVDLNCAGVEANADRAGDGLRWVPAVVAETLQETRLSNVCSTGRISVVSGYSVPSFMYQRLLRVRAVGEENYPSHQRSGPW